MPRWNYVDPRACAASAEWQHSLDVHVVTAKMYEDTISGYGLGLYIVNDDGDSACEDANTEPTVLSDITEPKESSYEYKEVKMEGGISTVLTESMGPKESSHMHTKVKKEDAEKGNDMADKKVPTESKDSVHEHMEVKEEGDVLGMNIKESRNNVAKVDELIDVDSECCPDHSEDKVKAEYGYSQNDIDNTNSNTYSSASANEMSQVHSEDKVKSEHSYAHCQNSTEYIRSSTRKSTSINETAEAHTKDSQNNKHNTNDDTNKNISANGVSQAHSEAKLNSDHDSTHSRNNTQTTSSSTHKSTSTNGTSKAHSETKSESEYDQETTGGGKTTGNRLAMPLYYVSPAVAQDRSTTWGPMEAGWYVCAPRTSHFEIRVSPLFGSLTKKRFASAYDDVLVWLYVDGAVCNVEGNIATKHSDIVYQGIKQIADGDTTVVSRFMFQAAKMTEEEAVRKGEGDGGQDEVGTIRLVFKGAYKGKHEPIGYERYQNHVHKARAKVTEKEAIKKGKSLGVGKGAALNVKRSKHADFEYPEHLQTELFEHEIVIRLRECFWMESRKLVDVKGRACTHSMSGREVKGESSGKRPRLQSDWDLGIKNEDGIIDLC